MVKSPFSFGTKCTRFLVEMKMLTEQHFHFWRTIFMSGRHHFHVCISTEKRVDFVPNEHGDVAIF